MVPCYNFPRQFKNGVCAYCVWFNQAYVVEQGKVLAVKSTSIQHQQFVMGQYILQFAGLLVLARPQKESKML